MKAGRRIPHPPNNGHTLQTTIPKPYPRLALVSSPLIRDCIIVIYARIITSHILYYYVTQFIYLFPIFSWPGIEPGPPSWQARIQQLNNQCLVDQLASLMVEFIIKKVEKCEQIIPEYKLYNHGLGNVMLWTEWARLIRKLYLTTCLFKLYFETTFAIQIK